MKSLTRFVELVCATVSWDIMRATENCPMNTAMLIDLIFGFLSKFRLHIYIHKNIKL